jgi:hypothetical protein
MNVVNSIVDGGFMRDKERCHPYSIFGGGIIENKERLLSVSLLKES